MKKKIILILIIFEYQYEINNLQDLINLAKTYNPDSEERYVINMKKLHSVYLF